MSFNNSIIGEAPVKNTVQLHLLEKHLQALMQK